tara:strand:+ start:1359 stop:1520 length:162 start_codon:yes stop_codon:yes gene_type:complete
MPINIPKPRRYETEKEYILKYANNAYVIQQIPNKQARIDAVRAAFKQNFNPKQ